MPTLNPKVALAVAVLVIGASGLTVYLFAPQIEQIEHPTREFTIVAKQFEFLPNEIRIRLGERVVIHLRSIDVAHGFGIIEFGVNIQVPPGETVTVSFVADKKGSFVIFCTVFCGTGHPNHKGILIVG